jgi:hypothetical protein
MSNVTPTTHPPVNDAGDGQVISESRVKQGRKGYAVFAVLAVSTVLAVILVFGLWGMQAGKLSAAGAASKASRAAASQSFTTPESAPRETPGPGSAPAAPDH